jgi:hypothetical protein
MIWIILTVVVVFLIATGMPLIRDNLYQKRRREEMAREQREDGPDAPE